MNTPSPSVEPVRSLEERLLRPEVRASPAELAALLADDFIEFGSSGRIYDRRAMIESLRQERAARRTLSGFRGVPLTPDVILATYRVTRHDEDGPRQSLRSSIWKRCGNSWRMVFHHGTATTSPSEAP